MPAPQPPQGLAAGKATWSAGSPTFSVDAAGTVHASVALKDAGVLAVTIALVMTADHGLRVDVTSAPGDAGLSAFTAWSNK